MIENKEGPGAELKAARESMNVSTREVADALNLPGYVIESLEADDYDRLTPSVFTRGYLRSYARLLELDPDPLLARYPEVTEEVDAVTGEMPAAVTTGRPSIQTLALLIAAAVVIVVFLIWWFADDEPAGETDAAAPDPVVEEVVQVVPEEAVQVVPEQAETIPPSPEGASGTVTPDTGGEVGHEASREVEPPPLAVAPQVAAEPVQDPILTAGQRTDTPTPAPGENEVQAAGTVAPAGASESIRKERRITEFGDDRITFEFGEDCWVEVKTAAGENLYSDLNRAGQTLVLTGRAPFRILLGYAPGVSLSFNDEEVPLARHTRNNVASLILGED